MISGTYILLLVLDKNRVITTKRSRFHLNRGFYAYVGSALNNLDSRLKRHLSKNKKLHWHIDFLLEKAVILKIIYITSNKRIECGLAKSLNNKFECIRNFGSSDCKCTGHLFFSENYKKLENAAVICLRKRSAMGSSRV